MYEWAGAVSKAYRAAKGEEKLKFVWELVKSVVRHSARESFWKSVKTLGIRQDEVKGALKLLEESGELEIKCSIDGRHLYVSTLKRIQRDPVRLDRWLTPQFGAEGRTPSPSRRKDL